MWQSIKRARFISKYNQMHFETGDLVRLHLWLQKNGWPANEMVDAFMQHADSNKNYPWGQPSSIRSTFWHFMVLQYRILHDNDSTAMKELERDFLGTDDFGPYVPFQVKAFMDSFNKV